MNQIHRLGYVLCVWTILAVTSQAAQKERPFSLKCRDGFTLQATYRLPESATDASVSRAIILIHGSGPHSFDEDLTSVTRDKKKNLFFRDLAGPLAKAGFAVVRYNKRSFQINAATKKEKKFAKSDFVKSFSNSPLKFFVDDARDCVDWTAKQFPKADIYLLGHSQGTYVALQVARNEKRIRGVAMIGFYLTSLDTIVFEQLVYRSFRLFRKLDKDNNGQLDKKELEIDDPIAKRLRPQVGLLDRNGDKQISASEFKAGNLSNLILRDFAKSFRKQEAAWPRPAEILKGAKFKVAFFQGMLDNQTPAYHTQAFELYTKFTGKKRDVRFHYFDGLGHALDQRDSYDDLKFNTIDPKAKKTLTTELDKFFVREPKNKGAKQ